MGGSLQARGEAAVALTRMLDSASSIPHSLHERREGVETRFIVRTLVQNLRVNANWRSIIGPLARAVIMHRDGAGAPKASLDAAAAAALDAFHTCPSLDLLVPALVEGGIEEMRHRCSLTPGLRLCRIGSTASRREFCILASTDRRTGKNSRACCVRCSVVWDMCACRVSVRIPSERPLS